MTITDRVELTGIAAFAGTAHEVGGRLSRAKDQQVVAFMLPHGTVREREAIAQTVEMLVKLTAGRLISRKREMLESLVNAWMPAIVEPKSTLREAGMIAKARAEVLESTEWLTAVQVAELANLSTINPNAQPTRWKREGRIFSIKPAGSVELFPAYGLDASSDFRPVKELAEVIKIFADSKDSWGLAYWFASINSFLGGRRPQDVLSTSPGEVIAAAVDEAGGVMHG